MHNPDSPLWIGDVCEMDFGVMECMNIDEEHGRRYGITEKGEPVLGLL